MLMQLFLRLVSRKTLFLDPMILQQFLNALQSLHQAETFIST